MTSTHGNLAYNKPDYSDSREFVIVDKPTEWITTVEAAKILKVSTTKAVRYLMEQYPNDLPGMNIGTDAQPRWMLRRADVERFQANRETPEN
jgi:hypothetical protein